MNIELMVVGKTDLKAVEELSTMYAKRINFYLNFKVTTLPDLRNNKNMSFEQQKMAEGEALLKRIETSDYVVVLDEGGSEYSSQQYAAWLNKRMVSGVRRLIFIIGGPYGFSQGVYDRANEKLSLSQMTFSHQIVRAIFAEQLYRAMTIIKGEPYHHA